MKKILIVENSSVVIIGLMQILEDIGFDKTVVDNASSFEGMLAMIDKHTYGLVFFWLKTDPDKQLKPFFEVVQKHSSTVFLVFSEMMEINMQMEMYRAGIKGIIDKTSSKKEIIFAIKRLLDNGIYVDKTCAIKLIFHGTDNKKPCSTLTEREKQVAELLAEGKKNHYICHTLNLMPSTVSTFKAKIFNKLNVKNIVELKEWKNATQINKSNADI